MENGSTTTYLHRWVQCDPLRLPYRGNVSCTDGSNFLSVCTYSCDEGFGISSGTNIVRVCTAAAEWTGIEPRCTDTIKPEIVDCPGPLIIYYLDMNEQDVTVVWVEPTVVDNVDYSLTASLSEGHPPGSSFAVGTHKIVYTATDTSGNVATPCEFTVSVREITCPVVYKKPYQIVTCPSGNSYGSRCEFSCEDGSRLIGTNFTYCGRRGDPPVGYWDWDRLAGQPLGDDDVLGPPRCQGHPCRDLRVPQNGALACDAWLKGKFCSILCNDRYDIPPGLRIRNSLWVCGDSGNWDYPDPPHCSARRRPNSIRLPSELQYFVGDCLNPDAQEQIMQNFVQIFQHSGFGYTCAHLSCTVDNVNVICDENTRRNSDDKPSNSSETFVLTIQFDFALPISDDMSVYDSQEVLYSLAEETNKQVSSGNLTLRNITGSELESNKESFTRETTLQKYRQKAVCVLKPGIMLESDTATRKTMTPNNTSSFSGFISNVNIWNYTKNEMDLQQMARTCVNTDVGNALGWSQFGTAQQLDVSIQIPSFCDDTDECASAPCGDNLCVDQLRNYSCICKEGFTGRDCKINIDDCLDNVCENNATCLDGVGNSTCLCPDGFVGDFCGISSVCKNLTNPLNGFATCNSTDNEINCTISCQDGFEFYDQPVLHYHCGQSTAFRWNHESPRNPMARFPPCTEFTQSVKTLVATLKDLEIAAMQLENQTLNDVFTVYINNNPYTVNNNATKTYGVTECNVGETAVMFYCVPCPVGTSFSNGKCMQCNNGTYQNETGQVYCKPCPPGLTTEGFGAFEEDDCIVETFTEEPVTNMFEPAPGHQDTEAARNMKRLFRMPKKPGWVKVAKEDHNTICETEI
ncbi:sushi, von Willebrand factor type A, EGF and pentraxin domain-containing protein 1-like [Branchiostoma floridae]|uniref:Sushi, von Willebrand factor type A, EGF and pentraxin domain-containing protein 1-like n=1 Tax=Branchiostoma floridae TaxID=7739 RepID=A0A9J7KL16_BRAFL|nr:sushi, von Willebrand factor type A, EGF and pentraxin domain-containing protein 1-like [Branchiostoma floridae]